MRQVFLIIVVLLGAGCLCNPTTELRLHGESADGQLRITSTRITDAVGGVSLTSPTLTIASGPRAGTYTIQGGPEPYDPRGPWQIEASNDRSRFMYQQPGRVRWIVKFMFGEPPYWATGYYGEKPDLEHVKLLPHVTWANGEVLRDALDAIEARHGREGVVEALAHTIGNHGAAWETKLAQVPEKMRAPIHEKLRKALQQGYLEPRVLSRVRYLPPADRTLVVDGVERMLAAYLDRFGTSLPEIYEAPLAETVDALAGRGEQDLGVASCWLLERNIKPSSASSMCESIERVCPQVARRALGECARQAQGQAR